MDDTLEVRWFLPGDPSSEVLNWFRGLGAEPESSRVDLYLVSNDPAINVKLREGKVQTKHRIGDRRPISFADNVNGVQERWVKWSFPTIEQHHDLFDDDPTGLWIPVHKKRRRLSIPPDVQRELGSPMIEPDPTLAKIELTEVRARNEAAWTICVEAEGRPSGLPGTLQQTGNHLFEKDSPVPLSSDASYGYAQWIRSLESSSRTTDSIP